MTSDESPFAKFYDNIFKVAPIELQEEFLRDRFSRDGRICSSFYSFFIPDTSDENVIKLFEFIKKDVALLKNKLISKNWQMLYDFEPLPDNYDEFLIEIIEREYVNNYLTMIHVHCYNGNLLDVLANIRVVELGLDLDWENVAEPANYYGREIAYKCET